jgi:hypothetical protein
VMRQISQRCESIVLTIPGLGSKLIDVPDGFGGGGTLAGERNE